MPPDLSFAFGLAFVGLELLVLAAVGFLVARVVLRQADDRLALAQGMLVGPALWGLIANFASFLLPSHVGVVGAWAILLAIGGWMLRRPTIRIWPRARTAAGWTLLALMVFWIALAARQLIAIPDPDLGLGLAAVIQTSGTPPVLPWAPWSQLYYHYGASLLVALLVPPTGPDLAFMTEVVGAYAWTGFALVIGMVVLQRSGWVVLAVLAPLLLSTGAWTLIFADAPVILRIPVPAGFPEAGIRASLGEIYRPTPDWPWVLPEFEASPPNIWKPSFTLAYGLALIVLERVVNGSRGLGWPSILTLAILVGFIGLLDAAVALVVMALWGLLGVTETLGTQRVQGWTKSLVVRAVAGPALTAMLLVAGGGLISGFLATPSQGAVEVGWINDPGSRHLLGTLDRRPGGLALMGMGPVAVAAMAVLLGHRARLVLALAAGSGVLMLAALMLQPYPSPIDAVRLDGHARNFALLAILIAAAARLQSLKSRWKYAACGFLVALVTWPTVAASAQGLGHAARGGIHLSNAKPGQQKLDDSFVYMGREPINPFATGVIVDYIRSHTAAEARILSPYPQAMSVATGRLNASGFLGHVHLWAKQGPDYLDAIRYLEPAAIERLGVDYIHATDDWVSQLPPRSVGWLSDTRLFEPLVRDGSHALYRVRPGFLQLDATSHPGAYEALRQTVPEGTSVYVARGIGEPLAEIRAAVALPHAHLLGDVNPFDIFSLTAIETAPLGATYPDVVLVPREIPIGFASPTFPAIWWNQAIVAYSTNASVSPPVAPPSLSTSRVHVRLSEVRQLGDRVRFTIEFIDYAPEQWTHQDWLLVAADDSPLALPREFASDGRSHVGRGWLAGHVTAGSEHKALTYEFDAGTGRMSLRGPDGEFDSVASSEFELEPGGWTLLARFQHDHLQAAVVPVMTVVISETDSVSVKSHEGELNVNVNACPSYLQHTGSCRALALKADSATVR